MLQPVLRFLFAILLLFPALPALAQGINLNLQTLQEYNHIQPLQNPEYDKTEKILGRRVLDAKNSVVGEVQDILLAPNGSINSIKIEFDRLQLGTPVYLNYRTLKIQSVTNGYQLGFRDTELAQMYPELLANVETAAGNATDNLSLQRLAGAPVTADDGRTVGTVQDVLFSSTGNRAQALYVSMNYGVLNGQTMAIPFKSGAFGDDGQKLSLLIPNDLADAMISFASHQ